MSARRLAAFTAIALAAVALVVLVEWSLGLFRGTAPKPTDASVVGRYTAVTPWGSATLAIAADHTFEEHVRPAGPNGPIHPDVRGRWSLEPAEGTPSGVAIHLVPFTHLEVDQSIYQRRGDVEDVAIDAGDGPSIIQGEGISFGAHGGEDGDGHLGAAGRVSHDEEGCTTSDGPSGISTWSICDRARLRHAIVPETGAPLYPHGVP